MKLKELRHSHLRSLFSQKSPFCPFIGPFYLDFAHKSALRAEAAAHCLAPGKPGCVGAQHPRGHCSPAPRSTPPAPPAGSGRAADPPRWLLPSTHRSGSREVLLPPRPLRTGRESCPSSSSSVHQRPLRDAAASSVTAFTIRAWSRRTVRQTFLHSMECQSGVRSGAAPAGISAADISACLPESVGQGSHVTEHLREVSPLSR